MPEIVLNKDVAKKVLETVDAGLVSGFGEPIPGKMCVEAAAYAADAAAKARIKVLSLAAQIGLEALQALKSPGCEWLDLCE